MRRLYPDGGVPLSWREDGDSVQELVQSRQQVIPLLGLVGHVMEHLVRHHGGHRSPDLVVGLEVAVGSEHHKQKPGWDGNLSEVTEDHGLLQSDEGRQRLLQEVDLPNQDVRGLGTLGDLLHKVTVNLHKRFLISMPQILHLR